MKLFTRLFFVMLFCVSSNAFTMHDEGDGATELSSDLANMQLVPKILQHSFSDPLLLTDFERERARQRAEDRRFNEERLLKYASAQEAAKRAKIHAQANAASSGDRKTASADGKISLAQTILKECKDPQKLVTTIYETNKTFKDNKDPISMDSWRVFLTEVDAYKQDEHGDTLLHHAARLEKSSICKILMRAAHAKEVLMVKNNEGKIPLELAANSQHVCECLIKAMGKVIGLEVVASYFNNDMQNYPKIERAFKVVVQNHKKRKEKKAGKEIVEGNVEEN